MKKFMIPILMLCLGYAGMMHATNTDISTLNNVIYIEPFTATQGTQVQMSIKMKNTVDIRGFQFDLYLPDGVTAAKTSKGKFIASLTADRLPVDDEHTLTLSEQSDGAIRFLCGSLYDETFTGTDGEIAKLTINIGAEMANGNHPIYLKNMKLTETNISNYYETELIETCLILGPAGYTVLDETSTIVPVAASGVNVLMKRTINADQWSTICLPFSMSETQVKTVFGNDVELGDFSSWSSEKNAGGEVVAITVGFTPTTAIEANHPYIIKVTSAISEFKVDGVNMEVDNNPTKQVGTKDAEKGSFIGAYVANTTVPQETLFLNSNKFWYSTGNTKIKAFRGWFEFADVLTGYEANAPVFISFENGTTGISENERVRVVEDDALYNLNGQRVVNPRKGLYIKNNQKIIVK